MVSVSNSLKALSPYYAPLGIDATSGSLSCHHTLGKSLLVGSAHGRRCSRMSVSVRASSRIPATSSGTVHNTPLKNTLMATVSTSTQPSGPQYPATSGSTGSPLLWIGVGVALCVVVTKSAEWLKGRVMKLAMEQMMKQMGGGAQGSPFGGFPPSSPQGGFQQFPGSYQPPPPPFQPPPPSPAAAKEKTGGTATVVKPEAAKAPQKSKPAAFVDVESSETSSTASTGDNVSVVGSAENNEEKKKKKFFQDTEVVEESTEQWSGWSGYNAQAAQSSGDDAARAPSGSPFSVDQFEKMLETPALRDMVLQYLPEEMRNPETLKWMLQQPAVRQQLEQQMSVLSNGEYGNVLKQYDMNNPDVMKQYENIGVTPQEAMQKLMENPELAQSFTKPKVQAALMDCAKNPMNQMKYINDREIMDVFEKIATLFPNPAE